MSESTITHSHKSHTPEQIAQARERGDRAWILDTGTGGEDDVLLGVSREAVLADVLVHHDIEALPAGWTLAAVDDAVELAYTPDRSPTGVYLALSVWRHPGGPWMCSHPTDPKGPDIEVDTEGETYPTKAKAIFAARRRWRH